MINVTTSTPQITVKNGGAVNVQFQGGISFDRPQTELSVGFDNNCDYKADNTNAVAKIHAARGALTSKSFRTIKLNAGTYYINQDLVFTKAKGIKLVGDRNRTILKLAPGVGIKFDSAEDCEIEDLFIDARDHTAGGAALILADSDRIKVRNVNGEFTGFGIVFQGNGVNNLLEDYETTKPQVVTLDPGVHVYGFFGGDGTYKIQAGTGVANQYPTVSNRGEAAQITVTTGGTFTMVPTGTVTDMVLRRGNINELKRPSSKEIYIENCNLIGKGNNDIPGGGKFGELSKRPNLEKIIIDGCVVEQQLSQGHDYDGAITLAGAERWHVRNSFIKGSIGSSSEGYGSKEFIVEGNSVEPAINAYLKTNVGAIAIYNPLDYFGNPKSAKVIFTGNNLKKSFIKVEGHQDYPAIKIDDSIVIGNNIDGCINVVEDDVISTLEVKAASRTIIEGHNIRATDGVNKSPYAIRVQNSDNVLIGDSNQIFSAQTGIYIDPYCEAIDVQTDNISDCTTQILAASTGHRYVQSERIGTLAKGVVIIPSGQNEITITHGLKVTQLLVTPEVEIDPLSNTSITGQAYIDEINYQTFKIKLPNSASQDVQFRWRAFIPYSRLQDTTQYGFYTSLSDQNRANSIHNYLESVGFPESLKSYLRKSVEGSTSTIHRNLGVAAGAGNGLYGGGNSSTMGTTINGEKFFSFAGGAQRLETDLFAYKSFTFFTRFRRTSSGVQVLMSNSAFGSYSLRLTGNNKLGLYVNNTASLIQEGSTTINANTIYSAALVYNHLTRAYSVYLNGSLEFSGTYNSDFAVAGKIFYASYAGNSGLIGQMNDIMYITAVLSGTNVNQLHTLTA